MIKYQSVEKSQVVPPVKLTEQDKESIKTARTQGTDQPQAQPDKS